MRVYLCPKKTYAVSVVVPMYNAEEYIAECLESLLLQTFQDFEVIVVDDCSTDNSVAVAESFLEKFGGRLKLSKTEKNSGGAGYVPRNIGLTLASGMYIYFLDADDFLLLNALELLYRDAKKCDADVICLDNYYYMNSQNEIVRKGCDNKRKSSMIIDNPSRVVYECLFLGDMMTPWSKFVRRDFLIKNEIYFPEIIAGGDNIWSVHVCSCSKRFLRIPLPVYFYRCYDTKAVTKSKRAPREQMAWWISSFVKLCVAWNEFATKNEILKSNYNFCYKYLTDALNYRLKQLSAELSLLDNVEIYEILQRNSPKTPDSTMSLLPFLFSFICNEKKTSANGELIIRKFGHCFTAKMLVRMDKKTEPENLRLLSVSDGKARISRPEWWQKNGVCHMIDSYAGKLEIISKANVDGQVQVRLSGAWVPNPEDKTKRLPYWIDYMKLVINEETVFDKLTPAWHDKPYVYNMNVKAGEEIKIQTEWLPHRDDRDDLSAKVAPPQEPQKIQENNSEKLRKSEALISELRTALDNEKKLHNKDVELINKFKDYFTARADIQLVTKQKGDFQIISVSDDLASVTKPKWFQKGGIGYVINSCVGKLEFVAKSSVDGQIKLRLRGLDVRTPEDKTKRIPYWINYTKLIVDDEIIFDEITPAWLEKFYSYNTDIKAGEEIKIKFEWLPHRNNV